MQLCQSFIGESDFGKKVNKLDSEFSECWASTSGSGSGAACASGAPLTIVTR